MREIKRQCQNIACKETSNVQKRDRSISSIVLRVQGNIIHMPNSNSRGLFDATPTELRPLLISSYTCIDSPHSHVQITYNNTPFFLPFSRHGYLMQLTILSQHMIIQSTQKGTNLHLQNNNSYKIQEFQSPLQMLCNLLEEFNFLTIFRASETSFSASLSMFFK